MLRDSDTVEHLKLLGVDARGLHPSSGGFQPKSYGLQPRSVLATNSNALAGLQPKSYGRFSRKCLFSDPDRRLGGGLSSSGIATIRTLPPGHIEGIG